MKYFSVSWRTLAMAGLLPILVLIAGPVVAHTALTTSLPADGAVVNLSPAELRMEFNGPVQLMKLNLLHMGEHAMEIGFKPITEARSEFVFAMPDLSPASYTVEWAAIGADGHTVTNSFAFTVDPAAAALGSGAVEHHGDHHDDHPTGHTDGH